MLVLIEFISLTSQGLVGPEAGCKTAELCAAWTWLGHRRHRGGGREEVDGQLPGMSMKT